jgi:hypothetical protein
MIYTYCTFSKYKSDFFDKVEEATPSRYSEDEDIRTVAIMPTKRKKLVNDSVVLIPNSEFEYLPNQFTIDDTELLRGQDLVCLPESFGYSIEQGEKVFPPFTYPKCSENSNQNDTYLHIDRDSNTLYMDCPDDDNNQFITGPVDKRRIVRSNEVFYKWKVEDYDSPTDASEIEFAIGTCKDDEYFTQATMAPRFNKSLFDSIPSKSSEKPRIIYFLTLDSMSRRHFFRKLPRVVKVLNDLNKDSNFSVFDFKLHNILGPDSISNQVPIMGGKDRFRRDFRGDQNIDFLGDKAMWNLMRKKGFISLLGLENCDNYFPGSLGRMPTVDYSVGPFYCAVQKYSGVMFDKKFKKVQRCLGGHQTHYYLLNYTRSLVKMYPGANFWLYNHLNAAHEATGQHASTLNDDISEYLEDFLNTFGEQYDIWIYLHADHGMRYGNWFQDTDAYQENKLPSLFVISSKSLLEKYKYSYFTLKTNSERLTSKLDLRETTLFLAGINETSKFSVNLLEEVANKSRTCNECSIDAWDCACNAMEVVEKPCNDIEMILENLKNYAEKIINSASYADPQYPLGRYCRKIVLEKITKIYHVSISNIHEFFKLEIESSTQKGMKFQINYILASDNKARRHLGFSCESTIYNSRVWMKALSISRLDTFAGPCEIKSRNLGLKPEFCACVD